MQNLPKIKARMKSTGVARLLRSAKQTLRRQKGRLFPKGADALRLSYAKYYAECTVDSRMVLYEAYAGRGLVCSPYAIFKMFQKRSDFGAYTHVWAVESQEQQQELKVEWGQPNVSFVVRDSDSYCRYLCMAKFLINNLSFPNYFTKKPEQVYINTWHGIPLKTLGFDIPDGRITGLNTVRNFLSVDVFLSPNRFMTECFRNAFRLEGLYEGHIMESGMPRNDNLFHTDRQDVVRKLQKAGVCLDEKKKLILYAPTWKGQQYSNPDTGTERYLQLLAEAEKHIDSEKYQVLVKPHQIVYKHMAEQGGNLTAQFIPASMDANELLSAVDILISDYSSIYFDYLATGKPILFYIPDLRDYQEQRGLYFGTDKLPGPVAQTLQELGTLLDNVPAAVAPYREKYEIERRWACGNDDGHVCGRVIDQVIVRQDFSGMVTCDCDSKKKILLYSGDLQSEKIRRDFMEWLEHADYGRYDITVIVPHTATKEVLDWIRRADSCARILRRTGKMAVTPEHYKDEDFLAKKRISDGDMTQQQKEILLEICRTEMRRTVGQVHFDYAADFSGNSVYYQNLFASLEGTKLIPARQLSEL